MSNPMYRAKSLSIRANNGEFLMELIVLTEPEDLIFWMLELFVVIFPPFDERYCTACEYLKEH